VSLCIGQNLPCAFYIVIFSIIIIDHHLPQKGAKIALFSVERLDCTSRVAL